MQHFCLYQAGHQHIRGIEMQNWVLANRKHQSKKVGNSFGAGLTPKVECGAQLKLTVVTVGLSLEVTLGGLGSASSMGQYVTVRFP